MKVEAIVDLGDGVIWTLRNTLRQVMLYEHLSEAFVFDKEKDPLAAFKSNFVWIVGHTSSVKGMKLTLPKPTDSPEKLNRAFEQYFDGIDQMSVLDLLDALNALKASLASLIERPDEALTEEQATDPNS